MKIELYMFFCAYMYFVFESCETSLLSYLILFFIDDKRIINISENNILYFIEVYMVFFLVNKIINILLYNVTTCY